jgi:hypothetical protein
MAIHPWMLADEVGWNLAFAATPFVLALLAAYVLLRALARAEP